MSGRPSPFTSRTWDIDCPHPQFVVLAVARMGSAGAPTAIDPLVLVSGSAEKLTERFDPLTVRSPTIDCRAVQSFEPVLWAPSLIHPGSTRTRSDLPSMS